jgi:hypothetical protein
MSMNRLPAITGIEWLKQGFSVFRRQPGLLTMLLFTNMMISMLFAVIPFLGTVLTLLLIPAFSMSVFEACRLIDHGQRVTPGVLLTGVRQDVLSPLMRLGGVYLALFVVVMLVVQPFVDMDSLRKAQEITAKTGKQAMLPASTVFALMGAMFTLWAAMLALTFAPAAVYWKKMPTFKAVFYSVFAVVGSLGPLMVMLMALFGISLALLLVLAVLLGSTKFFSVVLIWLALIFTLLQQCAMYSAYKQLLSGGKDPFAPDK